MSTSTNFAGSIPGNYERFLGPFLFEPYAVDLVARVSPEGLGDVLEIACGTGRVTRHLRAALPPGVRLVATDVNADMMAIAREVVPGQVEWNQADAQALPYKDGSFDLVVCQFGLMFVPDKAKAAAEACRVLKPGGRLLFSTWDKLEHNPAFHLADGVVATHFLPDPPAFFHMPFSLYDEDILRSLFEGAGFSDVGLTLVEKECTCGSAVDLATGMLEGSPMQTAINERKPGFLPVLKEELTRALAEDFGDAPLRGMMRAWVVKGTK